MAHLYIVQMDGEFSNGRPIEYVIQAASPEQAIVMFVNACVEHQGFDPSRGREEISVYDLGVVGWTQRADGLLLWEDVPVHKFTHNKV